MLDVVAMIGSLADATSSVSEQIKQRDAEKNASDVKAAAIAAKIQALVDELTTHIAQGDINAIRKDDAE